MPRTTSTRSSTSSAPAYDNAKQNLMDRFSLDDVQAQAILDMRLKALQGLDREKLESEYKELEEKIAYYLELLADESSSSAVLRGRADRNSGQVRRRPEDRDSGRWRTRSTSKISSRRRPAAYTLSNAGLHQADARGHLPQPEAVAAGASTAQNLKEEDYVKSLFIASTHDHMLFFTESGTGASPQGLPDSRGRPHCPGHRHCQCAAPESRRVASPPWC